MWFQILKGVGGACGLFTLLALACWLSDDGLDRLVYKHFPNAGNVQGFAVSLVIFGGLIAIVWLH